MTPPEPATVLTADLFDVVPDRLQVVQAPFRSYGGTHRFHGPVLTARVREDNGGVKAALDRARPGQVLVVDGGASLHCALLGDNLAARGLQNGLVGIVIHGAVRDVAELAALGVGVLALGSNPRRPPSDAPGEQGVDLAIGGVVVREGAYLYADEDGVVVADAAVHD